MEEGFRCFVRVGAAVLASYCAYRYVHRLREPPVLGPVLVISSATTSASLHARSASRNTLAVAAALHLGAGVAYAVMKRSDPRIQGFELKELSGLSLRPDEVDFCAYCELWYRKEEPPAKHCHECNTCTRGFDHHCGWLNHCIGANNYGRFFVMISCFVGAFSSQVGLDAMALVARLRSPDLALVACSKWRTVNLSAHLLCAGSLLAMLSALLGFHGYLVLSKRTTYEVILAMRTARRQRIKDMPDNAAEAERACKPPASTLEAVTRINASQASERVPPPPQRLRSQHSASHLLAAVIVPGESISEDAPNHS